MDDAQFGIVKILKPYTGYETDYQGQITLRPIMFTEGGLPLDEAAGKPGYSPFLIRGLAVPFGARVVLWLPIVIGIDTGAGSFWNYKWQITWRLRNVFDYRSQRKAFHYPKQGVGVADTNFPPPDDARVVIPAALASTLYSQPRPELFGPTNQSGPTVINQADLVMVDGTNIAGAPFIPGGHNGYAEQGLQDPAIPSNASQTPSYLPHEVQAEGDEMLISLTRDAASNYGAPSTAVFWDFTAGHADHPLSLFLAGSPDIGVYVSSGKAT